MPHCHWGRFYGRRSFNAEKMKPVTITKRASEFINRGDIAGRIQELRKPAIDAAQFTLEEHLNALKNLEMMPPWLISSVRPLLPKSIVEKHQAFISRKVNLVEIRMIH
jgi:hypothetical protein